MADKAINTASAPQNIYIHTMAMTIRFDIRYAQFLIMISNKNDTALRVLADTQKMLERTLYPNPQQSSTVPTSQASQTSTYSSRKSSNSNRNIQ